MADHIIRANLVSVYISYIRPVMEYGAPVWHSGLSNSLGNKIEKVQRRAVRIILGASFTSYSTACAQLGVALYARRHELTRELNAEAGGAEQHRFVNGQEYSQCLTTGPCTCKEAYSCDRISSAGSKTQQTSGCTSLRLNKGCFSTVRSCTFLSYCSLTHPQQRKGATGRSLRHLTFGAPSPEDSST
ncbi:hypothetical protein Bbelb_363960 [Branchiostoma belcheri]|nr:hypothetical protein Bbelb_363960 [Branchiostoma belcheri]